MKDFPVCRGREEVVWSVPLQSLLGLSSCPSTSLPAAPWPVPKPASSLWPPWHSGHTSSSLGDTVSECLWTGGLHRADLAWKEAHQRELLWSGHGLELPSRPSLTPWAWSMNRVLPSYLLLLEITRSWLFLNMLTNEDPWKCVNGKLDRVLDSDLLGSGAGSHG